MDRSDSESDSDWTRELFIAVSKKQGKGKKISERDRCRQIKDCLDQGAKIDTQDDDGNTVLHKAVAKGYQEVVKFLRQRGAAVNICNQQRDTAIMLARKLHNLEMAGILEEPIEQRNREANRGLRSSFEYMSVNDHQTPTTSRECNLLIEGSSPTRASKRGPTIDGEPVNAKRKRLASNDSAQREETHEESIQSYVTAGSKKFMHGNIYQLKYLMLILYRAWKRKCPFRLATEMMVAEKFDDVVLSYVDNAGDEVHSFVQVKHKQNVGEMIRARDLLADDISSEPFSVLKYFKSWRKIKKHPDFSGRKLKHFILCTNIGLDVDGLKTEGIEVSDYVGVKVGGIESQSEVWESDEFLIVTDGAERIRLCNLSVDEGSELHRKLESASDMNLLARELAQRVYECKSIDRRTSIFKDYHAALAKEIIDTGSRKLSPKFVRNIGLSDGAKKFRSIFLQSIKALQSEESHSSDEDIWASLEAKPLQISEKFGEKLQSTSEPELTTFSELSDDEISYQDVLDFLGTFVLAVNQPDEVKLGEMIKCEVGVDSQFNLLDAGLVADAFQNYMLDWFKKKSGDFLINESADVFFEEIESKLSSFIAMGLSLKYPEELDECGIRFEHESTEVRNLVDSSNSTGIRILELITSGQTFLTALRVYQTLMQIEKFKKSDSFIFITLKSLLLPKIMDRILRAFKWPHNHDLLIVDCESISAMQYRAELWNPLCKIMRKNSDKRMILIIQGTNDSAIHFKTGYKLLSEDDDSIGINSLEKSSQQKLLEREVVSFQGKEECFGRLLGIHDFDNIESKKLADLGRIIDPRILVQLIKSEEIQIGGGITGLGKIKDYYIPRKIVRHVTIKVDILRASEMKDLLVVGGIDRETVIQWVGDVAQPEISFISDHEQEADQFEILCQQNPNRKIHWLQRVSGKLIWIQSLNGVSNLVAYKDTIDHGATYIEENDLVDFDEQRRIVILSDIAGMGKTTILTSLAQKIKDKHPSSLVITINLTRCTSVLDRENAKRTFKSNDTGGAVDFLVDELERLDTNLERQVYKTILKGDGEAVLLFDGFDEISPTYGDIVMDLVQALAKLPIKKIVVTTRPHTSKALEEKLGTFSYNLEPFSRKNQIEFIKKFWKQGLNVNHSDQTLDKRLELRAERVIELLVKSVNHKMMDFTGIPLQTMLVANFYRYRSTAEGDTSDETVEITALEDDETKLPEKIDIIDLYRNFVDEKCEILFTKNQFGDPTNLVLKKIREQNRLISFTEHQKFALNELFRKKIVSNLLTSQIEVEGCITRFERDNTDAERTGIVTTDSQGKLQFIHRTFAEYLAATFLIEILKDDSRNLQVREFFVAELFVKPQYKTIRAFIDCLLSRENPEDPDKLENNSWKLDLLLGKHRNESGQTLLHVATLECNFGIVKFFLNLLGGNCKNDSENKDTGINLRDFEFNVTALAIAIYKAYDLNVVKLFVERGADIHWKNFSTGETLLHVSITKPDSLALVKYLCDNGADVNIKNFRGRTPLHYAVSCSLDVVKHLIENGADLTTSDVKKNTPLHYAAAQTGGLHGEGVNVNFYRNAFGETPLHNAFEETDYYDVVKYLCDQGADVNCKNINEETPLHLALRNTDSLRTVNYLCDKGADLDCQNVNGETPLHLAVRDTNGLTIVKYLCDKGAKIDLKNEHGMTPLHLAAQEPNNFDKVKCLCDKQANVNCKNELNETPLHLAAKLGKNNLSVVKYLCSKGADTNLIDEYNETPLHLAVCEPNNIDMVTYLCDNGADIHCQGLRHGTPLHCAVYWFDNLNIVEYLCSQGSDINCRNKDDKTPLYLAILRGSLKVVKYLCDNGADIDCQDKDGRTLLHCAADPRYRIKLEVATYLCDKTANINCRDKYGNIPLHFAVVSPHYLEIVEYLCDKGADIHCQNKYGDTPLHCAATNGRNLDIVKYLCDKGANINCQSKSGKTPLHYTVAAERNLDTVKYLCDNGANVNCLDNYGHKPVDTAKFTFANLQVVQYLHSR